ncbi:uncharacterized protein Bfra_003939 [Botrytis fragariae]|uniref:2EXR domain-containing protein n=1 Tax=Botrytis fragariae TaxID=1964551 RepID=A0A8H6AY02_9HELO|nr:uncharacterized protein Bfra_003939 [Botrytis fragariae]KAF5875485.1 hypothetical protein Bfra_003939 [Botrytis fragariae]
MLYISCTAILNTRSWFRNVQTAHSPNTRVLSALEDLPNYFDNDLNDGATFICFMKLPLDIRVMIWQASLPGPRVVLLRPTWIVRWKSSTRWGTHEVIHVPDCIFESSSPITTLYVCRESFNIASTRYTQTFASPESPFKTSTSTSTPCILVIAKLFIMGDLAATESLDILTLVTRRYPHNAHAYTPDRYGDLSFIDLQDLDVSLNFYKSPYEPKLEESFQSTQQEYAEQLQGLASIKFDVLEEFCTVKCGEPEYEMPIIRNMSVTTTSTKAKLGRAKAAFRVKKAEYMKSRKLLAT